MPIDVLSSKEITEIEVLDLCSNSVNFVCEKVFLLPKWFEKIKLRKDTYLPKWFCCKIWQDFKDYLGLTLS